MNIVQIHSGLGNQMFQYAFLMDLRENGLQCKADISVFDYRPSHNGYELDRVFMIDERYATKDECNRLADVSKAFFPYMRRKLGFTLKRQGTVINEPDPAEGIQLNLLKRDECYFIGYWQSERYFADIKPKIRSCFRFRQPLSLAAQQTAQQIAGTMSVGVHIRRGDYLKKRRQAEFDICGNAYYTHAVSYMQQQLGDCRFFVFSDDEQFDRQHISFPADTVFVSPSRGEQAWQDMQLMSMCKHNIIANSSFSWWAAWLNSNTDKIIVAPHIWFRTMKRPDIIPDNWIKIDVD